MEQRLAFVVLRARNQTHGLVEERRVRGMQQHHDTQVLLEHGPVDWQSATVVGYDEFELLVHGARSLVALTDDVHHLLLAVLARDVERRLSKSVSFVDVLGESRVVELARKLFVVPPLSERVQGGELRHIGGKRRGGARVRRVADQCEGRGKGLSYPYLYGFLVANNYI